MFYPVQDCYECYDCDTIIKLYQEIINNWLLQYIICILWGEHYVTRLQTKNNMNWDYNLMRILWTGSQHLTYHISIPQLLLIILLLIMFLSVQKCIVKTWPYRQLLIWIISKCHQKNVHTLCILLKSKKQPLYPNIGIIWKMAVNG